MWSFTKEWNSAKNSGEEIAFWDLILQINSNKLRLIKSTEILGTPCLSTDREKELEAFQMAQQGCLHQKKGQAVLYEGGKGYGKSQLLAEINLLAQKEEHR